MMTHKQHVRRRVRVAQIVAGIAAAVGAAAVLAPIPSPSAEGAGTALPLPPAPAEQTRVTIGPAEIGIVAAAMNRSVEQKERLVARVDTPPVKADEDAEKLDEKTGDRPGEGTSGAWQFVGTIMSPSSKVAIVNDEAGVQHFFREGEKHNATKVVEIAFDHIVVKDGEDAPGREIKLQPRSDTMFPDAAVATFVPSNSALPAEFQKPPVGFDTWSPEEQQQWQQRRIAIERQINEQRARQNQNQRQPAPRTPVPGTKVPVKDIK
ncbi:MAG: hypothetical protein AB7G11_10660 [Phycisphaerales bacterium]